MKGPLKEVFPPQQTEGLSLGPRLPDCSARAQPASPPVTTGPLLRTASPWEGTVSSPNESRGGGHHVAVCGASRVQGSGGLRGRAGPGPGLWKEGSRKPTLPGGPAHPRGPAPGGWGGTALGTQPPSPRVPGHKPFLPGVLRARGRKLHPDSSLFLEKSRFLPKGKN